eukprot:7377325-Prymnesium_polylepis.2
MSSSSSNTLLVVYGLPPHGRFGRACNGDVSLLCGGERCFAAAERCFAAAEHGLTVAAEALTTAAEGLMAAAEVMAAGAREAAPESRRTSCCRAFHRLPPNEGGRAGGKSAP